MRFAIRFLPLLLALPVQAAETRADLLAAPEPFAETYVERVPVGGRTLVGLIGTATEAGPAGEGLVPGRLTLPGSLSGPICVRALTEDGRYEASNTFVATGGDGGQYALGWSGKVKPLTHWPLAQLAILTTIGPCGATPGATVPTGVASSGPYLRVLVNTRGAVASAALRDPVAGGPALARAACHRLDEGTRVAFDAACVLGPLTATGRFELRIEQQGRDGLSMEAVSRVTVLLGGAP